MSIGHFKCLLASCDNQQDAGNFFNGFHSANISSASHLSIPEHHKLGRGQFFQAHRSERVKF
jgi:hypothetical protein